MTEQQLSSRIKNLSPEKWRLLEKRLRQRRTTVTKTNTFVSIDPSGHKSPLFFFHLRSGHTLAYLNVARHMESHHPIHGVEAEEPMPDTMQALAEKYANAIQTTYPSAEYYNLSGWSFGGLLALETARCLQQKGKQTNKVILIDTHLPGRSRADEIQLVQLSAFLNGLGVKIQQVIPFLPNPVPTTADELLKVVCHILETEDLLPFEATMVDVRRMHRIFLATTIADAGYKLTIYDGDVTLIKAQEWDSRLISKTNTPDNGWSPWVNGNLKVAHTTGHHFNLFSSTHVPKLAQQLNYVLTLP